MLQIQLYQDYTEKGWRYEEKGGRADGINPPLITIVHFITGNMHLS